MTRSDRMVTSDGSRAVPRGIFRYLVRCLAGGLLFAGATHCFSCQATVNELLLRASQGDVEARRQSIVELGDLLAEKESSGFPFHEGELQALEFLREVAVRDPEAMNRMRAISSLRGLHQHESTDIYIESLRSPHWIVRWEAAKALRDQPVEDAAGVLVERLRDEPRAEVLIDIVKALAAIGNHEALGGLLQVYLDKSGRFRDNKLKAYEALVEVSGKSYGFEDYEEWLSYWQSNYGRAAAVPAEGASDVGDSEASGGGDGDTTSESSGSTTD